MMKSLRNKNNLLDGIDRQLINALTENSRISTADLARLVGLSAPSVSERMKRLEEADIIQKYTIKISPEALGLPISVWLKIRPMPGQLQKIIDILKNLQEIVECDRVTGEDCFLAKAHVQTVQDLEALIDEIIPYAMTNTSIIQSSPIAYRLPPILQERHR